MKKLILSCALVAVSLMNAQQFGLKAGLNVANVTKLDLNSKADFYGGLFLNVPISSTFSIQPELLYSGQGAKNGAETVSLSYLTLPVMFQYNATPNFYLEGGPQFGFLLSGKNKISSGSTDIKDYLHGFDFGLGLGLGYFFTPVNIGITARYVAGLSDITKDSGSDKNHNNVFQIGLAYKFGGK